MCHCHRGIRRSLPGHPSFAQRLDLPSALFTLHPGWDISNMQRAALGRKAEWHELDRLCTCQEMQYLPHRRVSAWHQIGSRTAGGTERRRGATWTRSASRGLQRAPSESGLRSRASGSGPAAASAGICVSKSAFGPGSVATAGSGSERREEAGQGRAVRGPGSHQVWLLAGVALQVRRAPKVGGALSAHVPPTTATGPSSQHRQPLPGPGPLGTSAGEPCWLLPLALGASELL